MLYISGMIYALALIATSLVFLCRVRVIYSYSKAITTFFGFWWLAVVGTSLLVPFGVDARVGYIFYCRGKLGITHDSR